MKRNGVTVVGGGPCVILAGDCIFRRDQRRRSESGPDQFPLPIVNRHRLTAVPPAARAALVHAPVSPAAGDAYAALAAVQGGRGAAARPDARGAPGSPAGADRRDGVQHARRLLPALVAAAAVVARYERVHRDGDGGGGGGGAGIGRRAAEVVVEPRRQIFGAVRGAGLRREDVEPGGLVDDRLESAAGAWLVPRGGGG